MTTAEILQALERYTGKFPEAAMRAAVEQREAITPELLRALQAVADDAPRYAEQETYMLHLFALYLLAQFREKRAYPLLIKLISWPGDTADSLLGDTTTEGLPGLLASVFDGNLEALVQVALNEQAYPFVRSSATDALVLLYLENLITREQILEAFRRLYRELKEEGDPQPWNGLVDATADAGLTELLPELRTVCEKGLGEDLDRELGFFEAKLKGPRAEVEARFKYHRYLIQDAIKEMSWWAAFKQEKRPAKADKERKAKIGRNDPCPCGSGKKYKKCCLGKAEA